MAASFAALESRLNQAVILRLANVDATLNGLAVSGIFDSGYEDASLYDNYGPAGSSPRFTFDGSVENWLDYFLMPAKYAGLLLTVTTGAGAGTYRVANALQETNGMVTLHLLPT